MIEPETPYLLANGAVLVLILGQMLRMERRFGQGDSFLDRIQKHCPLFNGNDNLQTGGRNVSGEPDRKKNPE